MPILFQKGILCTSNYNDMEHKPEIDGVELNENTTKEDLDIDKVFQYRGQVATYNQLPTTGLSVGDTYNVQDTGENYAWNGSDWDCLTGAEAVYYKDSTLKSQDLTLTINADNNTISNLETDNLKDGVLQTTIRDINTATDTNLASEKAIRTELNTKQATITGAATTITSSDLTTSRALISDANGKVAVSDVTSTELGYLDGVTSSIQTQLSNKQPTITGAATTITSNNLTTNKALISNGSGKVAVSTVSNTELGYLANTTSNIQTQLNTKGQALAIIELEATDEITLADNTLYTGATQTALTIALPSTPILGFLCEIDFSSGATVTDWDDPGTLDWFGDDVINNEFTPVTNTRYTIIISYDGVNYMAFVKGIA